MNCMNCGAYLTDMDLDYCTHCGCNVLVQKKVDYLSKYYYNQGLEKASIRDLSGAINCLKQSLTYNKGNIQARNLLGLVYFETGEVVAALSEWVISKNLQPGRNLASEYIDKLQANPNKLEAINETIKKYNDALALCREGHEDMAAIRLKKILTQNSKLIKGYHLLALIQIKNEEWNKARRTLRKAAKIDKTNTTTLRFLREVDEQTGVTTKLEHKSKGFFKGNQTIQDREDSLFSDQPIQPPVYKARGRASLFFTLMAGFAAGAVAFWLLAVPAIRQGIYREANKQIVKYSESLASQGVELSKAQNRAQESGDTMEAAAKQLEEEKKKASSYEALMVSYSAMLQENWDEAALKIQQVYVDMLSDDVMGIYNTICANTGVSGIESSEEDGEAGDGDMGDPSASPDESSAGDGYQGEGSPDGSYTGDGYSGDSYSGDGYSGDSYSGDGYSGDGYSGDGYSGDGY